MQRISDDFKQLIFDTCDIQQVISGYVKLSRTGRQYKGLCPFHGEKTPSFMVYPDTHSYFCFGCHASGTVIGFIMQIENLSYIDAVKFLCERYGLQMPDVDIDDSLSLRKKRMYEMNAEAARFFHSCLKSEQGKDCLSYYYSRGYSPQTITHFGLGYAPDDWRQLLNHLHSKGYRYEEIYAANLANKSEKNGKTNYYDSFRNRAMVPIIDVHGHVIAFGGRVLDDSKPKYINTSDTLVYKKSKGVFGLNFAKNSKQQSLILVEGYMDAIALHQAGFTNTIACLGTALTDNMALLLRQYCEEIILCYDNDEAGQKATARAIEIFDRANIKRTVIKLQGGKDPDEILKKYGPERFRQLLEGKKTDTEFQLAKCEEGLDLSSNDGKVKYLDSACKVLAQKSEIERSVYADYVARQTQIDKSVILRKAEQISKANRSREISSKKSRQTREATLAVSTHSGVPAGIIKAQEAIIAALIINPDFAKKFPDLSPELFLSTLLQEAFSVIFERAKDGRKVSPEFVSDEMSSEAFTEFMAILHRTNVIGTSAETFQEWIDKLKSFNSKKSDVDVSTMSDDEFKKLIEAKANQS